MNPFREYIDTLECAHMGNEFEKFQEAFNNHERVIILGNGGSSSVASHISQDYMKFRVRRYQSFLILQCSRCSLMTLSMRMHTRSFLSITLKKKLLLSLMSSGGESKNILNCLEWCELNKVDYGVLTGFRPENTIRTRATNALWNYYIASEDYGVVECVHQIFLHGVV